MAKLDELLTTESVTRLYDKFVEGVDYLPVSEKGNFGLNAQLFEEVGEPILRFIHQAMYDNAVELAMSDPARKQGFTRESKLSPWKVLRNVGVSADPKKVRGGIPQLAIDASRVLVGTGLVAKRGKFTFLMAPWDASKLRWLPNSSKVDEAVERRIAEESAKAEATLTSTIDLRTIKLPEQNTPEAVMAFVERFVAAAMKVQAERDTLKARASNLQRQVEGLVEELEQLQGSVEAERWGAVVSKIGETLSGNDTAQFDSREAAGV